MKIPHAHAPLLLLWAGLVLNAVPGRAGGDETEQERAALGAMSYRIHCLNCHGDDGTGDGPMAELLKISPSDLTRLAEAGGGEFPRQRVLGAIDGRDQISSHGNREMPVWGIGLQDPGRDTAQDESVRDTILDLVAYLETLQAGAGPAADEPGD